MRTKFVLVGYVKHEHFMREFRFLQTYGGMMDLSAFHAALLPDILNGLFKSLQATNTVLLRPIYLISTHNALVNIFGHLVARKVLQPDEIAIALIDREGAIHHAHYDAEGYLQNYPCGFFEWDADELISAGEKL